MCQYSFLSPFQGGSSGKGTTLRGRSDADLVVFLTNITSFRKQLERREEFIEEIRRQLEAFQGNETFEVKFEAQKRPWENPRALSFVLRFPKLDQEVKFDVLPAFDALGECSQPQVLTVFVLCQGFFRSLFLSLSRNVSHFETLINQGIPSSRKRAQHLSWDKNAQGHTQPLK